MRLTFLGTAGSEGYPNPFCECENCRQARALGGRNFRLRSAVLVNDDLLIDLGPDLGASTQRLGLSLSRVATALVTHRHEDHLDTTWLKMRKPEQTLVRPAPLTVFGPGDAIEMIRAAVEDLEAVGVELKVVAPFDAWEFGGYRMVCYQANHGAGKLQAQFYSVDDGRRRLLFASDTSDLPAETWEALEGQSFDCIVLEETMGTGDRAGHMGYRRHLQHVERFRAQGLLRPGGRVCATHFSHMFNPLHDEVAAVLEPHGVIAAYDGLTLDL